MILGKYWKLLMWATIAFLLLSVGLLVNNTMTTGSFLKKDIDLSGGKTITVQVDSVDISKIKEAFPYANIRLTTGVTNNLIIEIPFDRDEMDVIEKLPSVVKFYGEPGLRTVGPALGDIFFQQAMTAMIVAFILMAITVFILFRSFVPSLIVLLAAATDIIGTMGVLAIIDAQLSLPIIGALLALIGYSVGTDILLTAELLKNKHENYSEGVVKAAKTGITLTGTALVALICMFFISGSSVIQQIALVMFIGLVIDIPATWITNAGVLRLWLERGNKK
ncbi:hypothetical protein HYZ41_04380 [archaeon]|nr:hypothetical protein [archaeon]